MDNVIKVLYVRALAKDRVIENCVDLIKSNLYFMSINNTMDMVEDSRIETNMFIIKHSGRWNNEFWQLERR